MVMRMKRRTYTVSQYSVLLSFDVIFRTLFSLEGFSFNLCYYLFWINSFSSQLDRDEALRP